jgi:hypothetical protein
MINASIVTRWILFIVPLLGILWIPGILSLTKFPNANVGFFFFSVFVVARIDWGVYRSGPSS